MLKEKDILKYRHNISERFRKLEYAINSNKISYSKCQKLKRNYNVQLHLIDYILGRCALSDLLSEDVQCTIKDDTYKLLLGGRNNGLQIKTYLDIQKWAIENGFEKVKVEFVIPDELKGDGE